MSEKQEQELYKQWLAARRSGETTLGCQHWIDQHATKESEENSNDKGDSQ